MLEGEKTFAKGCQIRHANLEIAYEWIIKAWNAIKLDIIQKSSKEFSIANNLDVKGDDYLFMDQSNNDGPEFDDVPEDITEGEYDELFLLSKNRSS
ncbi:hypothetical protein CDAR_82881 [Caerostris darwini]|uniref:DDE-1 domain-containing protein n=1 Tax=Caerostris darwini TaxID=1538125 RepID=A0AAV4NSP3_9ARAC|nr:hypothetical protein CDAR_82881 [Caerostris darwini]